MTLFQETDDSEPSSSDAAERAEEIAEGTPLSAGDPITAAAAFSVVYSWYNFYVKGDEAAGIFVGLWAPTLLGAASYLQQKEIYTKLEEGLFFGR
ncbi:hypothetical protein [Saliphagus infecundisoli]|uniref:Uncharacterized protein n=1 Tax=Saliphagus infecundisoli TaxID=1849069 RepID=A0ABD5QJP9_9EURY|nr:hypothetical protein [Saliphagus infecundisoli]